LKKGDWGGFPVVAILQSLEIRFAPSRCAPASMKWALLQEARNDKSPVKIATNRRQRQTVRWLGRWKQGNLNNAALFSSALR